MTDSNTANENFPLVVSPTEIFFPPPLNRVITNILKLHNTSNQHVGYKVKTTARKRYCVRPNTGIIAPKETVEVQILLNFSKDQPTDLKSKDKFLIQSIFVQTTQLNQDLKQVWASLPEESIMKQKLKCYFQKPGVVNTATQPESPVPKFAPTIPQSREESEEDFEDARMETSQINLQPQQPLNTKSSGTSQVPSTSTTAPPRGQLATTKSGEHKHEIPEDSLPDSKERGKQEEIAKTDTVKKQLATITTERDELKRQLDKLTEKNLALEKEKELGLRQRKPIDTPNPVVVVKKPQQIQDQKSNWITYLIIAIVFFLLGRLV